MFYIVRLDTKEPFPLSEADLVLGRDPACAFCVSNTDVSRHHAQIQFHDGACWLSDLGSLNGTYLNGKAVDATSQQLHPNDLIQLGSVTLRFCESDSEQVSTEMLDADDGTLPDEVAPGQSDEPAGMCSGRPMGMLSGSPTGVLSGRPSADSAAESPVESPAKSPAEFEASQPVVSSASASSAPASAAASVSAAVSASSAPASSSASMSASSASASSSTSASISPASVSVPSKPVPSKSASSVSSSKQILPSVHAKQARLRPLELSDSHLLDVAMENNDQARILRTISQAEGRKFLAHHETPIAGDAPWTLRAQGYLQLLYDMTMSLGHCTDLDKLTQELLNMIFRWIDADRGCILLFDPVTNRLEPKAKKVRDNIRQPRLIISRTILDYVLEHQEGVLTSDATQDSRWDNAASVVSVGIHEAICVPLQGRYGIVGAIYLDTFSHPDMVSQAQATHRLNDDHLKLMITIAHHTAVAIEDTRHYSGMLQAERLAAVGQTVATLSHHIKNILQGIQGGSYLIETGLKQHNETFISKGWQIVEKNQNRISKLVLDMLTFSKDRKPDKAPGDLNATVADVVELMRSRAESQNVRLEWTPAEDLPEISFDAEGIHRAVLNLITNAIDAVAEAIASDKAAELGDSEGEEDSASTTNAEAVPSTETHAESVFADGGHIFDDMDERFDLETEPSESGILQSSKSPAPKSDFGGQVDVLTQWEPETLSVKIVVKDTGLGLSKEQINYIFRPFESSKGSHGTGLGLPVSQKIVSEHGGTIRVEQRLPRGSRFVITLPME